MQKAIIFDMDGVLFDTETLTMEALRYVSKKHGENTAVDEFYPTTCGTTLATAKLLYKAFFGESYPFEERREEMRQWMFDYISKNGIPQKPGVHELLSYLKDNNFKIALATSSTRQSAENHLNNAGIIDFFDATVCGNEIENSKPHPEIFLKAAHKLDVSTENCFVVEDSYLGVEAGYKAGMNVFMIPDMNPPRDKEKKIAYKICSSLTEIIEYL